VQDDARGRVNRVPFQTERRFVTLSPAIDSYSGMQYDNNPALAGYLPPNHCGFAPDGEEVPDVEFRSWPEKRGKK
jgi:hypothetical protein